MSAPAVMLLDPGVVDSAALWSQSYRVGVNATTFNQPLVSYQDQAGDWWQYAAWWHSNSKAWLGRRFLNPQPGQWETLELPLSIKMVDAHYTLQLGAWGGRLHLAGNCHAVDRLSYVASVAGLLSNPDDYPWTADSFGPVGDTLDGLDIGPTTYPTFLPDGDRLLLLYRLGTNDDGYLALAEYDGTAWSIVGQVTSPNGTWSNVNGSSTKRGFYWDRPLRAASGRIHIAGTWREQGQAVQYVAGATSNQHGKTYFYSDDHGRSWRNLAGSQVGQTGVTPIGVNSPGIDMHPVDMAYAPSNSVGACLSADGLIFVGWSYVPGRFVTNLTPKAVPSGDFATTYGKAIMEYATLAGGWSQKEIKLGGVSDYPLKHPLSTPEVRTGRCQVALDSARNAYMILPGMRILTASAASGYSDWAVMFDGTPTAGLGVYNECVLDTARAFTDGIISVGYQQTYKGFCVRDLKLGV